MTRRCGECQLCCRLLPVPPLGKPALQRCRHQKFGVGCTVYHDPRRMPLECRLWSCRWLVHDDTADLARPDRAHYVIDLMPDFITLRDNESGDLIRVQVVQIWCDPGHRDAHRDPHLRDYISRRGEEGIAALVRYDSKRAMTIIPPQLAADGQWHEVTNGQTEPTHSLGDVLAALSEPHR